MISKDILEYISEHSQTEPEILKNLHRETYLKMLHPRMISGHIQGRLLYMLSNMIEPENILEIGTFTGYSAICLSAGLPANGELHTIEINPELESFINKWIKKADLEKSVKLHIGDACEIIPKLMTCIKFDLVFIDAEKDTYPLYYKLLRKYLKSGAYIIADNVLWDGKVIQNITNPDKETAGIIEFNKMVKNDDGVENIILPFRDGISLIRIV